MKGPPDELIKRLLFILHWGFVELRNRALGRDDAHMADLADAMEILPGMIDRWDESHLDMIKFVLEDFERKHPVGRHDYAKYLSEFAPPEHF